MLRVHQGFQFFRFSIERSRVDFELGQLHKQFELILKAAVKHSVLQDEMPKKIYIVSDMEFAHYIYNADAMWPSARRHELFQMSGIIEGIPKFSDKFPCIYARTTVLRPERFPTVRARRRQSRQNNKDSPRQRSFPSRSG